MPKKLEKISVEMGRILQIGGVLAVAFAIVAYRASHPILMDDGSFEPSRLSRLIAVKAKTDFSDAVYEPYTGSKKVLVLATELKDLPMQNGKKFSTGNHPTEAFLPLLHLSKAGFEIVIATPTGKAVQLEEWAFPHADQKVADFRASLAAQR